MVCVIIINVVHDIEGRGCDSISYNYIYCIMLCTTGNY